MKNNRVFYLKIFSFLKFSIHLNRRIFVMLNLDIYFVANGDINHNKKKKKKKKMECQTA